MGLNWRLNVDISKKMFHADKGNSTVVSQIANACASVLTRKENYISDCIMTAARNLLQELFRTQRGGARTRKQECDTNRGRAFFTKWEYDRVTSSQIVDQAKGLVSTFEIVPRAQSTPHTTVRKVFMRILNLSTVECGWLMEKAGLCRTNNSKHVEVTTTGKD